MVRWDDVAKMLVGKRPFAPPMPATSTWVIARTVWSRSAASPFDPDHDLPITVKLEGRTIVDVSHDAFKHFIGLRFEQFTRFLHDKNGPHNLSWVDAKR